MRMENGSLSQQPEAEAPTRRRFYIGAIYAIGGVIGAALSVPAFLYLLSLIHI